MESLEDLALVLGMTPQVIAAGRPHLSVYAPQAPDPLAADPIVTAALALAREEHTRRRSRTPVALRDQLITARITATASGPENAEVTRQLVLRLNRTAPQRFVVLGRGPAIE